MTKHVVALTRYERPLESLRQTIARCEGLSQMPRKAKVFVKPNIVFWTRSVAFPKWGVITTSRVVEDLIILLKENGIDDITIGEGPVQLPGDDSETIRHAFQSLGYNELKRRYGVKCYNIFERPFQQVDLGDGIRLKYNSDILASDFVVNLPVLKTHAQTMVSLGIKNLKGILDIASRKKCHNPSQVKDLHFFISRLADILPNSVTVIDGIYSLEEGPAFDGKARRSNILVASRDVLAADKVGARLLGFDPSEVSYLVLASANHNRPADLSDVEVVGEDVTKLASPHEYSFAYNDKGTLPARMDKMGVKGISYPKYDLTLCTYCITLTGAILSTIAQAWKGKPWDRVEVLTGKIMDPTPGKKTILLGQCLYRRHRNHPDIENMIAIKTCPPSPGAVVEALQACGIDANPTILRNLEQMPSIFMEKYSGRSEFDESFFKIG